VAYIYTYLGCTRKAFASMCSEDPVCAPIHKRDLSLRLAPSLPREQTRKL